MAIRNLRITLLVDNLADPELITEHGLAMWIETKDHRILFDTGQGPALPANSEKLRINLNQADHVVLSHGHYDHTGGLTHVLASAPAIELFCHPRAVQPRYSIRKGKARAIHMPREAMTALDKLPSHRLHWTSHPVKISQDIGLTGPIPRKSNFEDSGGPFYLDPAAHRKDGIDDDMAIWINTPQGLVVCVGCSHAGLINTLNYIRRLSDVPTLRAVIGGFHLLNASSERIYQTVSELKALAPEAIVACHCTGDRAITALEEAFSGIFKKGHAGMCLQY